MTRGTYNVSFLPIRQFIAEAEYDGAAAQFLESWFPDQTAWAGINVKQPLSTFAKDRKDYGCVLSATGAAVSTSSIHMGSPEGNEALLSGACIAPFAFHTEFEANPWVTIDLGREAAITGVLVRNRTDVCQDRAQNLRLQVSDDGKQWREVWKTAEITPVWEIPLLGQNIRARYLRLDTRPASPVPFHLQHVEVWGWD